MPPEPKIVDRSYAVADPTNPGNVIKPNSDGSINVKTTPSETVTVTDKSGTTDGVDHTIINSNSNRINFSIECPSSVALNPNGDNLYVNLGAVASNAGGSFEILPGGYFPPSGMPLYKGDIHLIGVAGIKYTAKEFT